MPGQVPHPQLQQLHAPHPLLDRLDVHPLLRDPLLRGRRGPGRVKAATTGSSMDTVSYVTVSWGVVAARLLQLGGPWRTRSCAARTTGGAGSSSSPPVSCRGALLRTSTASTHTAEALGKHASARPGDNGSVRATPRRQAPAAGARREAQRRARSAGDGGKEAPGRVSHLGSRASRSKYAPFDTRRILGGGGRRGSARTSRRGGAMRGGPVLSAQRAAAKQQSTDRQKLNDDL